MCDEYWPDANGQPLQSIEVRSISSISEVWCEPPPGHLHVFVDHTPTIPREWFFFSLYLGHLVMLFPHSVWRRPNILLSRTIRFESSGVL
jgi:hypothetical protein